jgi:lipopolysaccharide transport system permease protein
MSILSHLREIWQYRELIRNLIVRDLKVRYKNSILGVAWSWISPLLMMIIYTIFFTVFWGNRSIRNYPVFLLCGLLPWNFFNDSIMQATVSVVDNAHLIKKVYFPREILPISIVLSNLLNFLIALPVFFILALALGAPVRWWALLLPITILIQVIFTAGLGLLLSTLNVLYRDTRHILGVLIIGWFFLTPVFYPIRTVPQQASLLGVSFNAQLWMRRLNPMASIVASYRDLLYWGAPTGLDFLLRTAAQVLIVFIIGYVVFLRYSPHFGEQV